MKLTLVRDVLSGDLLEHAPSLVGDLLVGRASLVWVDVVAGLLAELLLSGVKTWSSVSLYNLRQCIINRRHTLVEVILVVVLALRSRHD